MRHPAVTIDGPAGSGKSTIARQVAHRLGFTYLDTGALYRAAALAIDREGVDPSDGQACAEVVSRTDIGLGEGKVTVQGRDVTEAIRTRPISDLSSRIAAHPQVRAALMGLQRSFREKGPLVAEGRDTGFVLPDAEVKVYLHARLGARGQKAPGTRRYGSRAPTSRCSGILRRGTGVIRHAARRPWLYRNTLLWSIRHTWVLKRLFYGIEIVQERLAD